MSKTCFCGRTFKTLKELGEHLIWWYLGIIPFMSGRRWK